MKKRLIIFAVIITLAFPSCKKEWKPGTPLAKEKVKIGVVHITDPFSESSGYAYAHQIGIEEMKNEFGLADSQILYKIHIDDSDPVNIESAHRELIDKGVNLIFSTSWGYMDICEKLALEFPSVVFAHATGHKHNNTNFTNYFGRVYQARYLSGIAAGMKTKTDRIGFVAAWGTENSEVTGGINAFARGVEKVNPRAKIYVKVTHSWFDPMGEAAAGRALIAAGCDVIAQHCDTPIPQIEAERAGVWGIGYNTDMSADAPDAVITSILWHWGAYYTALVKNVIDGTFTTSPWFGSLKDGVVDIAPLNKSIISKDWEMQVLGILEEERRHIESGDFDVFSGIMETNDGRSIGRDKENLPDDEIRNGIDWYYHNVVLQ
ncbi:MAG: BMP family ABC transporter substrate-binding protein [Treponema sp.]|jgi:basic membrane protein A|nr:BMP family ABC transporter substrate-binding protein [Treponema sp.]